MENNYFLVRFLKTGKLSGMSLKNNQVKTAGNEDLEWDYKGTCHEFFKFSSGIIKPHFPAFSLLTANVSQHNGN